MCALPLPCPYYSLAFGAIGITCVTRDESLYSFPFYTIYTIRSPRLLGTVTILPRHIPLGFSQCTSKGVCYSLSFTMFPFCLSLDPHPYHFVKHNSPGILSLPHQTINYSSDVTLLSTKSFVSPNAAIPSTTIGLLSEHARQQISNGEVNARSQTRRLTLENERVFRGVVSLCSTVDALVPSPPFPRYS